MKFKNICLLRAGAIGDVIHTLPLVNLLAKTFKSHKITYAMGAELAPLMAYARGIDQIIPINFKTPIFSLMGQGFALNKAADGIYDVFINLQPNWKSRLIQSFAKSKQLHEYQKASKLKLTPPSSEDEHVWVNFAKTYFHQNDLLDANIEEFFPLINIPPDISTQAVNGLGLDPYKRLIALVPGVGRHRPHRAWPLKNWIDFIYLLNERGGEKLNLLLIGGPDEAKLCSELEEQVQNCRNIKIYNLCSKFNLLGTGALLRSCDLVIGGDTGPIHLATAVGAKTICLFGPTSPSRHAPFVGIGIQTPDYQCAKTCSDKSCSRKLLNCMESLSPEEVWLAMNEV